MTSPPKTSALDGNAIGAARGVGVGADGIPRAGARGGDARGGAVRGSRPARGRCDGGDERAGWAARDRRAHLSLHPSELVERLRAVERHGSLEDARRATRAPASARLRETEAVGDTRPHRPRAGRGPRERARGTAAGAAPRRSAHGTVVVLVLAVDRHHGVAWYVWGAAATDIPETVSRGTIVHLEGALHLALNNRIYPLRVLMRHIPRAARVLQVRSLRSGARLGSWCGRLYRL